MITRDAKSAPITLECPYCKHVFQHDSFEGVDILEHKCPKCGNSPGRIYNGSWSGQNGRMLPDGYGNGVSLITKEVANENS